MADLIAMDAIKLLGRGMAQKELRRHKLRSAWTGTPHEFAVAWSDAEDASNMASVYRARTMPLRQRLMILDRACSLVLRLERMYKVTIVERSTTKIPLRYP